MILTGGTSIIPRIRDFIENRYGGRVVNIDPFLSITRGFVLDAWLQDKDRMRIDGQRIVMDAPLEAS